MKSKHPGKSSGENAGQATVVGSFAKGGWVSSAFGHHAEATGGGATAIGAGSKASGLRSSSLGYLANASGTDSVAIGSKSTATEDNVVSIGSETNQRRLVNLADGVKDTDAVNLRQLKGLDQKLNKTTKELKAGIAGAMAMSGIPQVMTAGKSMLGASVGTYQGQNALAVGYSRSTDDGRTVFKLQAGVNTEKELGGSVGIGYQW